MTNHNISDDYFDWLYDIVCGDNNSYRKLLTHLHNIDFKYFIKNDKNRAFDGIKLRRKFAASYGTCDIDMVIDYLDGPCSILEMMIALAIRCEEDIADNPSMGNRTRQWFWVMIKSLGLSNMYDNNFDKKTVDAVIKKFLKRRYEPNGKGGLFTIKNCDKDMRKVEIWWQMCWYLDTII